MKAVILAGGTGTRLQPLTRLMNKHMIPVGKYPMISYAIRRLKEAGVTEIILITGRASAGSFIEFLGSGREEGVTLTYKIQEEAGGIAEALKLAENLIGESEKFILLLGDNLFEDSLRPYVEKYSRQKSGAFVLLKKVGDPQRYGVPVFDESGRMILAIEEKPERPQSDYCVTGIYMYDASVFKIIEGIRPSGRGELEITDVNNAYAASGELCYGVLSGWWTDAGTFESLYEAAGKFRVWDE